MKNSTRWMLAVSGGLLAALPWWGAPSFLLLICFVPLLFIEEDLQKEGGHLFPVLSISFIFFFSWNLVVTWWIARIHFIGGMSVIILNAAIMSLVFMLYAAIKKGTGAGVAVFVILWAGFEFLHHGGDLSWPWLSLGNGLAGDIRMVQWYEYTGMAGGTIWVLLVNVLLFELIRHCHRATPFRSLLIRSALFLFILIVPPAVSLNLYYSYEQNNNPVRFLVLQPVMDPYGDKFSGNSQRLDQLLYMAESNMHLEPDYIVVPETAVDSIWITDGDNEKIFRIGEFMAHYPGTGMIIGATTFSAVSPDEKSVTTREDARGRFYEVQNSALYFNSGQFSGVYHKHYLANGVEQVPFQRIFGFAGRLSLDMGGVSGSMKPGPGPEVYRSPVNDDAPVFGTLICFESSYGEYAASMARKGAEVLIVISNDGWFKNTGAYRQHLRLSRLRAIETRRDVVRAANSGISAHISSRGDIAGSLGWWEEGAFIATASKNGKLTFYARTGDFLGRTAVFFSFLMVLNLAAKKFLIRK
jgi:apolipoprotein N-acyltransferase